jgi:hypothetical protein
MVIPARGFMLALGCIQALRLRARQGGLDGEEFVRSSVAELLATR